MPDEPQQNATTEEPRKKRRKAKWEKAFLLYLSATGNVSSAAMRAGIERSTAYRLYESAPDFAEAWDAALEVACDALELEARRRAFVGTAKPVFYKGQEVGSIREYSDTLMVVLLKAHRPGKFRERAETININMTAEELAALSDEQLEQLIDRLSKR
jgi:hypothetical protein